jgi:hypothetical protein
MWGTNAGLITRAILFSYNVVSVIKSVRLLVAGRVVWSIIWGLYNSPELAAVPSGLSPTPLIIIIIIILNEWMNEWRSNDHVGTLGYLLERGHMADREVVGGLLLKCTLRIEIVTKSVRLMWLRIESTDRACVSIIMWLDKCITDAD